MDKVGRKLNVMEKRAGYSAAASHHRRQRHGANRYHLLLPNYHAAQRRMVNSRDRHTTVMTNISTVLGSPLDAMLSQH
jgi:hypothetical protein